MPRRDPQSAAIWKQLDQSIAGASKLVEAKSMNQPLPDAYWPKRRELLRQQTLQIRRMQAESAGQLTLPIFGDGTARKLAESEVAVLPLLGMAVVEKKA